MRSRANQENQTNYRVRRLCARLKISMHDTAGKAMTVREDVAAVSGISAPAIGRKAPAIAPGGRPAHAFHACRLSIARQNTYMFAECRTGFHRQGAAGVPRAVRNPGHKDANAEDFP